MVIMRVRDAGSVWREKDSDLGQNSVIVALPYWTQELYKSEGNKSAFSSLCGKKKHREKRDREERGKKIGEWNLERKRDSEIERE